jgi:hypothetical protein
MVTWEEIQMQLNGLAFDKFENGIWLREAPNLIGEFKNLNKRDALSLPELMRCHTQVNAAGSNTHTHYSPATMIRAKIPIRLFASIHPVLLIDLPPEHLITYWYDGLNGESFSNRMDYSKVHLTSKDNIENQYSHEYHYLSSRTISQLLMRDYTLAYQRHRSVKYEDEEYFHPWNEGLFRYKRNEVCGIGLLSERLKQAAMRDYIVEALQIRHHLNLGTIPFFVYDLALGLLHQISIEWLCNRLTIKDVEITGFRDPFQEWQFRQAKI